jgi:hypothetical protein
VIPLAVTAEIVGGAASVAKVAFGEVFDRLELLTEVTS